MVEMIGSLRKNSGRFDNVVNFYGILLILSGRVMKNRI